MNRVAVMLTLVVCCFAAVPSAWAQMLYGADGAGGNLSNLYILDPATGAPISTVGAIGFAVTGMAIHPVTGILYGSTGNASPVSPRSLITIDKLTGLGTLVGSFGVAGHTMADLAFTSDGTLYGWAEPGRDTLHTIDLATGQATEVGESGIGTFGSGLAATAQAFFLAGDGDGGALYSIDRATGRATRVGFFNTPPVPGSLSPVPNRFTLTGLTGDAIPALTFGPGGDLFGVVLDNNEGGSATLVTIDTVSGTLTVLGPTVDNMDAIVFDPPSFPAIAPPTPIPTLSELAFIAMALLLTAVALHQMRRARRV
jgi:hypothetical protein